MGKTSLVKRYVQGIFDDRYLTTIGVKIDKKDVVTADGQTVRFVLWDMAGEDLRAPVQLSYIRGASACLYVADFTRPETVVTAKAIRARVREQAGSLPSVLALNKADLSQERDDTAGILKQVDDEDWPVMVTSAKTGDGVEALFASLASRLL